MCWFITSVRPSWQAAGTVKQSGRFIWASLNLQTCKAQGWADGWGGLEEQGGDGLRYYGPQAKEAEWQQWQADWRMKSVTTQSHHVVITAVTEMDQLCCRRVPPGPWSGPTLGPGSGSGLWSPHRASPAPRLLQTVLTEARTTRWDRRSLWIHPAVSSGGETSSATGWRNDSMTWLWYDMTDLDHRWLTKRTDQQKW